MPHARGAQARVPASTFERIRYAGVYRGIDIDWYGNRRRLEYDLRLAPGADPEQIAVRMTGAEDMRLAANGDLLIDLGRETVRQRAPVAYQPALAGLGRLPVRVRFALDGDLVRFRLGRYDRSRLLVIDPLVLAYSTYLGGSGPDSGNAVAVDAAGAAYVTGQTDSTNFDAVGAIEGDSTGGDVFVSKLTPAGNRARLLDLPGRERLRSRHRRGRRLRRRRLRHGGDLVE